VKKIQGKLTYANVMATIAVFVALGGASYAAARLPNNSIGTKQVKKGSITLAKLSPGAREALKGLTGAIGPRGPAGVTGAMGSMGPAGSFAAKDVTIEYGPPEEGKAIVSCESDGVAIAGGAEIRRAGGFVTSSVPIEVEGRPVGWEAAAEEASGHDGEVQAVAICVPSK
jgi:hypothetical protein